MKPIAKKKDGFLMDFPEHALKLMHLLPLELLPIASFFSMFPMKFSSNAW